MTILKKEVLLKEFPIEISRHAYERYVHRVTKGHFEQHGAEQMIEAIRCGKVASRKFCEKHSVQQTTQESFVVSGYDKWIYIVEEKVDHLVIVTVLMRKNWRCFGSINN